MKKLLIIGAGGFGREVYEWATTMQGRSEEWTVGGFLDDNIHALADFDYEHGIIGNIKEYTPHQDELLICAIGEPLVRSRICDSLQRRGGIFINLIHPDARVSKRCNMGKGVIVSPGAMVFSNTQVGDFVLINSLTTIGHDARIGKSSVLSAHCDVMGAACLEEEVFLGSSAMILPSIRVGSQARVGAGSVVIRNVKEGTSVFGNPAKAIYRPGSDSL